MKLSVIAAALLAGCTFSLPSAPGAFAACEEWMRACRDKALMCGDDPAMVEQVYRRAVLETCEKVVWSDVDEVRNVCIPAEMASACDNRVTKCGGYAKL